MNYKEKPGRKRDSTRITVQFDTGTSDQIKAWGAIAGFEPGQETLAARSLMAQALASAPRDGLVSSARAHAYNAVRVWMMKRFLQSVAEMRSELQQGLKSLGEDEP